LRKSVIVALISVLSLLIAPTAARAEGGELFARRCSSCHGKDGKGDTAIGKKKNLRSLGSPEVQALSDDDLTARIADGGTSGDRQHAFKDKGLSDEDISQLVTFIRALARNR